MFAVASYTIQGGVAVYPEQSIRYWLFKKRTLLRFPMRKGLIDQFEYPAVRTGELDELHRIRGWTCVVFESYDNHTEMYKCASEQFGSAQLSLEQRGWTRDLVLGYQYYYFRDPASAALFKLAWKQNK